MVVGRQVGRGEGEVFLVVEGEQRRAGRGAVDEGGEEVGQPGQVVCRTFFSSGRGEDEGWRRLKVEGWKGSGGGFVRSPSFFAPQRD